MTGRISGLCFFFCFLFFAFELSIERSGLPSIADDASLQYPSFSHWQ
jgi:hypothetical protein